MDVFVAQPEFAVEEEELLVFPSVHDGETRTIDHDQETVSLAAEDDIHSAIVPGGMVEFAIHELGATLVCVEEYVVEE